MTTDSQLQDDVLEELDWEPTVDHAKIGVAVEDGIVTLSGIVGSYVAKIAAEKAARSVKGVRGIAEEILIRYPNTPKTADPEIAGRIADMLEWNATDSGEQVSVRVEGGWVTLSGEVSNHFRRKSAEDLASGINGVVGISNLMKVRNVPTLTDVRARIVSALKRSAEIDAKTITVQTDGRTVKLGGRVHHQYERRVAERAAWAAPGVDRVEDNIEVI